MMHAASLILQNMLFPILKTKRLLLRQVLVGDCDAIFLLRSNNEVNKLIDRAPCASIDDATKFIQTIIERVEKRELLYWAITVHGLTELIGTIGLFNYSGDGSKAEIGFELLPSYQRQGIMQEAAAAVIEYGFEKDRLLLIEAHANKANLASIKLLKKLNFINDGNAEDNFIALTLATTK